MTKLIVILLLVNFIINFPLSQGYFSTPDDSTEKQCFCEVNNLHL